MAVSDKTPEWLRQQQLRDQRRGRKKAARQPAKRRREDVTFGTLRLVITDRSPDNLQECYLRLKSPVVTNYLKRYRYHDARQSAVMKGEVIIRDFPQVVLKDILSTLSAGGMGWTMGKMPSDDAG